MRSRKGFELSINFIVIMMISIVVFGSGIVIFNKLLGSGQDYVDSITQSQKRDLDRALMTGDPVQVLRNTRTISRGDSPVYQYAVKNDFPGEQGFEVKINKDTGGIPSPAFQDDDDIIYDRNAFTLEAKGTKYSMVKILTNKLEKGSHIFTLKVICTAPIVSADCDEGQQYKKISKIYVNVR